MPDEQGLLTDAERERASAWLEKTWRTWACPFSGHTDWDLGETIVQPQKHIPGAAMVIGGGPVYPLLLLTCLGCGYTIFVNALLAGVFERDERVELKPGEAKEPDDAKTG